MLTTSGTEADQARAVVRRATTEIADWRVRLDDGAELTLPPELSTLMTKTAGCPRFAERVRLHVQVLDTDGW